VKNSYQNGVFNIYWRKVLAEGLMVIRTYIQHYNNNKRRFRH
jgi:hypothetical protein